MTKGFTTSSLSLSRELMFVCIAMCLLVLMMAIMFQ